MKRKYAAFVLGLTLAISSTAVYAEQTDTVLEEIVLEESTDSSEELSDTEDFIMEDSDAVEEVYGRVTAIDETSITIELGTIQDDMEKPEGETPAPEDAEMPAEEATNASSSAEDAEVSADADLTAEEENAEETDSTTAAADSENPAPEELPDGEAPENKPAGDSMIALELSDVNQIITITEDTVAVQEQKALEMLEEAFPAEEESEEKTDVEFDTEDSQDNTSNAEEAGEDTNSEVVTEDAEAPELPADMELIMIPVSLESEATEIDVLDITVDDIVKITLDEDGSAAVITVLPANEPSQN